MIKLLEEKDYAQCFPSTDPSSSESHKGEEEIAPLSDLIEKINEKFWY